MPIYNDFAHSLIITRVVIAVAKKLMLQCFRNEYIPVWSEEPANFYNDYRNPASTDNDVNLMNSINTNRKDEFHWMFQGN